MKKILVIDGNSIINRAFYGVRPLTTRSGHHTNATYGAVNIIKRQMDTLHPDFAAVAFDLKAPTFRHEMYPAYKAGRKPTPPELKEQFPDVKEICRAMGLHVLEMPGYEADDIQGTVAYMAHSEPDTQSYILTGDRDLLQLIDDKICVLLATNTDTLPMHTEQFQNKYGIKPAQFADMKAIMGDTSDNIPGVRGIGEKGAADLIRAFGTLQGVYDNLDSTQIKPAMRAKLEAGKEDAFLSKKLAKIDVNVPLGKQLFDLSCNEPDKSALYRKFTELELNSFLSRFSLSAEDAEPGENATEAPPCLMKVKEADARQIGALADRLAVGYAQQTWYFCEPGEDTVYAYHGEEKELGALVRHNSEWLVYDAKALWHRLDRAGITPPSSMRWLDLMLYAYVSNPGAGSTGIIPLCASVLGKSYATQIPPLPLYAELEDTMRKNLRENHEESVLDEIELPLMPILARMEKTGFRIDIEGMLDFGNALGKLADELTTRIYEAAGGAFNIQSPKQLGEVLYDRMHLDILLKRKSKSRPSTDAQTLEELSPFAPIVQDILEYRQVTKLRNTYAVVLPQVADENARVHTDFKQALTATGRLSSADPNLQNIPIRTKMGRQMRRYFIAGEGNVLVDADYSQIELRLLAHISEDYHMCEAFRHGEDIHRQTAAAVFGIAPQEVTEEERKRAKAVNFGIVYGIGGYSLSRDIGTSVAQATQYIRSYMHNYPMIEAYLDETVRRATKDGYSTTLFGRRRYIPELASSNKNLQAFGKRVAMNAPIQGSAADIIKRAMIRVDARLSEQVPSARLVMQVHDELIVECARRDAPQVCRILREEMEGAATLSVPLTVDVSVGENWLDQK